MNTLDPITREGTRAIKLFSKKAVIKDVVEQEDILAWSYFEEPKLLAPDRWPRKTPKPLLAIVLSWMP